MSWQARTLAIASLPALLAACREVAAPVLPSVNALPEARAVVAGELATAASSVADAAARVLPSLGDTPSRARLIRTLLDLTTALTVTDVGWARRELSTAQSLVTKYAATAAELPELDAVQLALTSAQAVLGE